MFKKFIERIVNSEDPINEVFYGTDGIDMAFQREKISWKEHQLLLALCEKCSK